MTRLAGIAVERDERRDTGCVNPLDRAEIKRQVLPPHQWRDSLQQSLLLTPNQFRQFARLNGRNCQWILQSAFWYIA
jgi:hypothetical protein